MKRLIFMLLLVALAAIPAMGQSKSNRDFERAKAEVERSKQEVQRELARAKAEIERAKAEMERAKAEIERAKSEFNRSTYSAMVTYPSFKSQKERDRQRKIKEAMRKGVVVLPMVTYPDDYINPGSKTDRSLPEELQAIPFRERLNCYTLKPEQITLAPQSVRSYSVYQIEDAGNETHVTFAVPIIYDGQWHAISKGKIMVDTRGDRYFPRRIERKIPFDKVLLINGAKGHTVLFTVVYPRLPTMTTKVTFTDAWPIKTELPLNRAPRRDMVVENVRELTRKKGRNVF